MLLKRILCLSVVLISFSVYGQDDEPENPYYYNKVYDYYADTIVRKPFHKDSVVHYASKLIGSPYLSPGRTPAGFDCSGFTFYCFREYSIFLPYTAHEQAELGKEISMTQAQTGDLIFFQGYDVNDKSVHHVGIVVSKPGEKLKFVHSASHGVHFETIDNAYYHSRFLKIRRVHP